jgi:hypothetical protein
MSLDTEHMQHPGSASARAGLALQVACTVTAVGAAVVSAIRGDSWAFGVWVVIGLLLTVLLARTLFRAGIVPARLLEPVIGIGLVFALVGLYAWMAVIRGDDIERQQSAASEVALAACAATHRVPTKWWLLSGNVYTFDRCLRQHDAAYPGLLTLAEQDACRRLGSRAVEVGPCRELGLTN